MKKLHFICIAVLFCTCSVNTSAQAVHYVKINGTGNGSTWALASGDLQAAINAAQPGDQVWVAAGTYFPNYNAENMSNIDPADRNNAMVLKEGIKVYGSFAGNENTLAERTATTIQDNPSILSGDLGTPGVATDNAYHIVISVGCTPATIFDGFTCTGGNANGTGSILIAATSVSREYGGALININSSPQFSNLTIIGNNAYIGGGGIYNEGSLPSYDYVLVNGNSSSLGGGIYNFSSSLSISNAKFSGNVGEFNGGAICNQSSTVVLTNVLITGNVAQNAGGGVSNNSSYFILTNGTITGNYNYYGRSGIYNERAKIILIRNSIIYGNFDTDISNWSEPISMKISFSMYRKLSGYLNTTTLESNFSSTDPKFVNAPSATPAPFTGGDYHFQSTSPLINVGNGAYFEDGANPDLSDVTTDLDRNLRRNGSRIDLGAYESFYALFVKILNFTAEPSGSKAKLQWTTGSEINNKEFIITRSADGKNFTEIGKVAGSGNAGLQNDYVFYDENPHNGINYYRLDQVDFDGKKTIEGIRAVKFLPVQNAITIYPNPVADFIKVTFGAGHFSQIELTDVNGKVLQSVQLSNRETEKKMDMANLSPGVYFVRLAGNGNLESRKVIK